MDDDDQTKKVLNSVFTTVIIAWVVFTGVLLIIYHLTF
jgi:heme/copper-type cytochrome/quinol oxidase subunit 4